MTVKVWWGEYPFADGQVRHWQMAGLDLQIRRNPQEWHIESHRHPQQHEDDHQWQVSDNNGEPLPANTILQRHIFNRTDETLKLLPRLADRPVVIKPMNPLFIAAGQSVTLFVSTPVWLSIIANDAPLLDIPIVRPTDTWFGASPIRGEICYATKVFGRTSLDQLPVRAFRAVTPVHIANHSTTTMPIERISIPAPLLPIYSGLDGRLWTPTLDVEQPANGRATKVKIDTRLHQYAGTVKLLGPARKHAEEDLTRLFESFFE